MDAILHLNIYSFPMILLACILVQMQRNVIKTTDNRLFQDLLLCSFILSGTELLLWMTAEMNFSQKDLQISILSAVYWFLVPFVPLLWLNYVYFHLKKVMLVKVSSILNLLLVTPLAVYYFWMILASVMNWIVQIDDVNEYLQESLYMAPCLLALFYALCTLYIIGKEVVWEDVMSKKKENRVLFFFVSLPFLALLIQMNYTELSLTLPATAVAELLVYLQIQRQEITQDALTGINNRRSFDYYFKNILEQGTKGKSLCLFMMDLDCFKEINDTCGHAVGDEVLIKAANLLSQVFQSAAGFVARYGGDEFCAIEVCQNEQEAEEVIKRLKAVFEEANCKSEEPYRMEISVGYAFLGEEGVSQNEWVARADEMMYQNKRRRKCT